jgi:hypothetical protein
VRIPGRNRFYAQTLLVGHVEHADDVTRRLSSGCRPGGDIMRKLFAGVAAFATLTGGGVFLQQTLAQDAASTTRRYLPEYNDWGELLLPKNFEKWVFVGSPLTPNALNGGQANFPEYHLCTSSPDPTTSTRRPTYFPKAPSSSRNCS